MTQGPRLEPERDHGGVVHLPFGEQSGAVGEHCGDRPGQEVEVVDLVDAESSHPTNRGLRQLSSPRGQVGVEEQGGGMGRGHRQQFTELAIVQCLLDPPVGRLTSPVVTDLEHHPGIVGRVDGTVGFGHGQGERLVHEHVLPGSGRGDHQVGMGRVGCGYEDTIDVRSE